MHWNIRKVLMALGHQASITALLFSLLADLVCSHNVTEIKSVSQCFSGTIISPLLTLYCGHGRRIIIRQVMQGSRRRNERSPSHVDHCGFLDGDCLSEVNSATSNHAADDETVNFTSRWTSTCNGRHFCVEKVGPALSDGAVMTTETDQNCALHKPAYLLVQYECLLDSVFTSVEPSLTTSVSEISTLSGLITPRDENSMDLQTEDICSNYSGKSFGLTMTSPGYPQHYPENTDCRCIVRTKVQSKVTITYKDIELTMTEQRDQCIDWLLLQSIGHGNSAAITCGHLFGADRVIASRGNQMLLHFHTASRLVSMATMASPTPFVDDTIATADESLSLSNETPAMKGFKIYIQADPPGEIRVNCHLSATDITATSLKSKANTNGFQSGGELTTLCVVMLTHLFVQF